MTGRVRAVLLVALTGALTGSLVAGCAGWSANPGLTVRIASGLDRPLLVYVNNDWVGTIPERSGTTTVPAAGHGGPPWHVEARTDAGRVLATLDVPAADAAVAVSVRLACGSIGITTAGSLVPSPAAVDPLPPCD